MTDSDHDKLAIGKDIWITTAREMLIQSGHDQIKIDKLAQQIGITRGSFYWHFKDRTDLLDHLVRDWERTNSTAILRELNGPGTPLERLRSLSRMWIVEREYSPPYDSAMRAWARTSKEVATVVRRVDSNRIAAFREVFLDAGYDAHESDIRSKVMYFHQVGYYAMDIKEPLADRLDNLETYLSVLIGTPPVGKI